jgi:hypothetical protein
VSVNDDHKTKVENGEGPSRGFLASLLIGLVQDAVKFVIAFAVGTGAGAIVCWYYGIPLVFSVLGGILVLALALVLLSDGLLS